METTALYVEYIVIGMETLIWIIMALFIIIGDSFKQIISYWISNIIPSTIMIIICYILGLVTDRISDTIFENRKKNIKNKYTLEAKTSIAVWEVYSNSAYAIFTLSRIRILRSTIINSIPICTLGMYLAYRHYNIYLVMFIFILSVCVFLGSNEAHKNLLHNYYSKTSALENKDKTKKKNRRNKK